MAKLPALVKAFATFDERGVATVEQFARVIREAGYLPTTKRGAGAADMGFKEAATLLIALSTSDTPKDAVQAVRNYECLERHDLVHPRPDMEAFRIRHRQKWPEPAQYVAESSNLISAIGRFLEALPRFGRDRVKRLHSNPDVEIPAAEVADDEREYFYTDHPVAQIVFFRPSRFVVFSSWEHRENFRRPGSEKDWRLAYTAPKSYRGYLERSEGFEVKREVHVTVTSNHLRAIHEAISST